MSRSRLYLFLSAACVIGFTWIAVTYHRNVADESEIGVCLFKRITTIPCPSCGSTRSVLALLKGDFSGAVMLNPFGLIILAVLMVTPVWLGYDLVTRKATLFNAYRNAERFLKRTRVAIALIILVLMNWIWNIYKGV